MTRRARHGRLAVAALLASSMVAGEPAFAATRTSRSPSKAGAGPSVGLAPWAGEWSGPWCAEAVGGGVAAGGCGSFVLTLVQRRDRLCGRHAGAAPGGRPSTGAAQSAIGKVKGGRKATLVVTVGEPVTSWLVEAERTGRTMTWRVVERLASADAQVRPQDLPASTTLAWSRGTPASEAVRAECRAHFADPR